MKTCYEPLSSLCATGEIMAARDKHVAQDIRWSEVHWHWGARRVIECAYGLRCAEHFNPELVGAWKAAMDQAAARYESGE